MFGKVGRNNKDRGILAYLIIYGFSVRYQWSNPISWPTHLLKSRPWFSNSTKITTSEAIDSKIRSFGAWNVGKAKRLFLGIWLCWLRLMLTKVRKC